MTHWRWLPVVRRGGELGSGEELVDGELLLWLARTVVLSVNLLMNDPLAHLSVCAPSVSYC